jgi:hypothetical protein
MCYTKGCANPAQYKIAARWSDGVLSELKTYALSCPACLSQWFRLAKQKQSSCRLTAGESLDPVGIFSMERGQRDKKLQRLDELEKEISTEK